MSFRNCLLSKVCLFLLLSVCTALTFGQESPPTAEDVIARYLEALGGSDRIAAITSFSEKGDGTSINLHSRVLSSGTVHWTFEAYFKAPNLHSSLTLGETHTLGMQGCDGQTAWYIDSAGEKQRFKPKPGDEYTCVNGVGLLPFLSQKPELKIQLKGKKKIGDRMAWEIRSAAPKSEMTGTFYFDAETHLLLRSQTYVPAGTRGYVVDQTYSDYRDVGGIKFPFAQERRTEWSTSTTTVRELKINVPIDNARFEEPIVRRGRTEPSAKQTVEPPAQPPSSVPAPGLATASPAETIAPAAPQATYVNVTNYIDCSMADLQRAVPDLKGLKVDQNQATLPDLLKKVGSKTQELAGRIPNLIADEEVIEPQLPGKKKAAIERFSYLIVAHRTSEAVTLDEYRVDVNTGSKIQSDDPTTSAPRLEELARTRKQVSARSPDAPPLSQGYASMWVNFYPANRSESTFRYLGQQKVNTRKALVLAFAQKPGSVRMPGQVLLKDKSLPVYYQGIAWVDPADFRILRLRSDLLEPIFDLSLTRLTSEVEFATTQAAGFQAPLWLPREVQVTSQVSGRIFAESHRYSNYRSFQVHTRLVLDE
jgi:hypothetical protein